MVEEIKEDTKNDEIEETIDISDIIDKPKKIYELVRECHSKKEFLKSRDILNKFLEKDSDSHVGNLYMGLTYLHLRDIEKAKKYFSHCSKLSPDNYLVHDLDMLCDFMLGDEEIIKKFDLKLLHASSDFTAFLTMALVKKMYELKKEHGKEVLQAPDDDFIKEESEEKETEEKETEEKETEEKKTEEKETEEKETEEKETEEKETEEKETEEKDSEEKESEEKDSEEKDSEEKDKKKKVPVLDEVLSFIYFNMAKFFSSMEKFDKAEPYFEKAISRYDDFIRINYSYGENLFFLKKYSEAIKQFEKAIEKEGEAPETMFYMGYSLKEIGYFKKSQYYFKKAIEKFSNFPEVLFALGEIAIFEERYEDAFDLFYQTSSDASMLKELLENVKEEILKKN